MASGSKRCFDRRDGRGVTDCRALLEGGERDKTGDRAITFRGIGDELFDLAERYDRVAFLPRDGIGRHVGLPRSISTVILV
jgi:hypothetical protein